MTGVKVDEPIYSAGFGLVADGRHYRARVGPRFAGLFLAVLECGHGSFQSENASTLAAPDRVSGLFG